MDVFGQFHTNPGLILTVPKQNSGLSIGSPLTQHQFHFVGQNSMPIFGLLLTKTQFITQFTTQIVLHCHGLSKWVPKISALRFQNLGPIKRVTNSPYTQNSPYTTTNCPNGSQKFLHFGSKIWDRLNGPSRPQTNKSITKHLNKR